MHETCPNPIDLLALKPKSPSLTPNIRIADMSSHNALTIPQNRVMFKRLTFALKGYVSEMHNRTDLLAVPVLTDEQMSCQYHRYLELVNTNRATWKPKATSLHVQPTRHMKLPK